MPLNKLPTAIGHSCAPNTTDAQFCLIPKQVQRYPKVDGPRKVKQIIHNDGKSDDECLADFGSIYSS